MLIIVFRKSRRDIVFVTWTTCHFGEDEKAKKIRKEGRKKEIKKGRKKVHEEQFYCISKLACRKSKSERTSKRNKIERERERGGRRIELWQMEQREEKDKK